MKMNSVEGMTFEFDSIEELLDIIKVAPTWCVEDTHQCLLIQRDCLLSVIESVRDFYEKKVN